MSDKVKIWMNKVMHRVMLSCDTASFYITKKEYQKLKCSENLQLNMHLMGCKFCRSFDKQNAVLSEKIHMIQENPPPAELSPLKKAEIEEALNKS